MVVTTLPGNIIMKPKHWCGMTAKIGTILSGAFSIISSNMHLIFEHNYLSKSNCSEYKANYSSIKLFDWYISCNSLDIVFFLSFFTIVISGFLVYSVYARLLKGLLFYIVWIIFYECVNVIIQIYTNNNVEVIQIRGLRWFGLFSRISMHCFWIFFVINEAHIIYKIKCKVHIIPFNRHVSISNGEFSQKLSNSSSFSQHY